MKPRLIFCAQLLLALAACKRDAAAMDVEPTAAAAADPVAQVPAVTAATAEIPVLAMQDAGVTRLVEFGGKVLGPMVKRIAPDIQNLSVVKPDDIEAVLKAL